MSWGTVLKLLVLAIGLRVVWGWAVDEPEDPPMETWFGTPAVPTAASGWTYPARHSSRRRRVGGLP